MSLPTPMVPRVDLHTLISVGLGSERKVVSLPGTEEIDSRSEFELMYKLELRRNPQLPALRYFYASFLHLDFLLECPSAVLRVIRKSLEVV